MLVGWATGMGVLTVIGTVITVAMLVYELTKLYRALNQTQVQKDCSRNGNCLKVIWIKKQPKVI